MRESAEALKNRNKLQHSRHLLRLKAVPVNAGRDERSVPPRPGSAGGAERTQAGEVAAVGGGVVIALRCLEHLGHCDEAIIEEQPPERLVAEHAFTNAGVPIAPAGQRTDGIIEVEHADAGRA
jgi:hypothetical protein